MDHEAAADAHDPTPLSFAQQRLWFLDQFEPGSALYNIPLVLDLDGPLDVPVLERSLTEILRRHEALRTVFPSQSGRPRQRVEPSRAIGLEVEDLSHSHAGPSGELADARIAETVGEPFDLSRAPLFRARLLKLSATRHVLAGAVHHIVYDIWSSRIFMHELTTLYEAFVAGRPSPLEKLPICYGEFARRERKWLRGEVLERELDYWRQQLALPRPELGLPTDHPRPSVASYRGARESTKLSADLTDSIKRLCRGERATVYMGFLAAFGVLLHRYTGQDDLIVGSPIANRTRRETEGLIGFFVNTLPLRLDLSGAPTFRELLERVRDVAIDAYEHQSLPFEKLVEELNPERSLSRSPIFQTVLNFHNVPDTTRGGVMDGPLRIRRRTVNMRTAKFDLTVTLRRDSDGLSVSAEYASDLFEAETIRRLLGHYGQLLTSATENPDQQVSALPMLTDAERTALLTMANATRVAVSDSPVHVLIEQQARRTPEAVAIGFEDAVVTYADLDVSANRLAHHLRLMGVGTGTLVGVCLDRGVEMVVAVLAVFRAGAAYVPLDLDFPTERLQFMADDAGLQIVITQAALRDRLGPVAAERLWVEDVWASLEDYAGTPPPSESNPDALAYVIYTSGSTGRPKGVEISHAALSNFLQAMRASPGIGPDDVLSAVTTLSFDIAMFELLLPLTVGAQVALMSRGVATDGRRLAEALSRHGATVMFGTPATYQMLLESGWSGGRDLKVLCGGEALTPSLARALEERAATLWNLYGPTETTICSTLDRVEQGGAITIGRPIANTEVYVLDTHRQLVPVGVPGELYIGGAGLARGYLGRDGLTAAQFVRHPFCDEPGARLYRTGDLVRWRPDGRLDYLGRTDRQVKVRGFRIEPGEIESALVRHPAVKTCIVEPRRGDGGEVRLVAYVVYYDHEDLTASEVRQFLRNTVPDYMVPGLVVELASVPLTPSGKVDRHALPDPLESVDTRTEYVPPSSRAERIVADVWQELLDVERVGRHDNFFELGGHSLLSIRAVYSIEEQTGRRLDPRKMFFQTLEQVAATLPDQPGG